MVSRVWGNWIGEEGCKGPRGKWEEDVPVLSSEIGSEEIKVNSSKAEGTPGIGTV